MPAFNKQVQAALSQVGYSADDFLATQVALLLSGGNGLVNSMSLDGLPGVGKTWLAECVATLLGVEGTYIAAHPGLSPEDVLYDVNIVGILKAVAGDRDAVRSSADVVELGFLPTIFKASQQGLVVAFVDELDKASPKIDTLFLTALQKGEVQVKGQGVIKANLANLFLFFTKNNERPVNEALMRRCRRHYLDYPSAELEMDILTGKVRPGRLDQPLGLERQSTGYMPASIAKVLVEAAAPLRKRKDEVMKPPATNELDMAGRDVVRLAQWGCPADLMEQVATNWLAAYPEDRKVLEAHVQGLGRRLAAAAKAASQPSSSANSQPLPKMNEEFNIFGR